MSIETAIAWLLSGGGIAAIVTLWTTRHKPQVDKNAQATDAASKANTALSTTLDQIQEERKTEREEWRLERAEMRERMAAQDSKIAALTGRVDEAEADAFVGVPLALWVFQKALTHAKRSGSLTEY